MTPPADGKNQTTILDLNLHAAGYNPAKPVCGISPHALRINFETQQIMAINLVRALLGQGIIRESNHVAVIGGGLSGVTTAAYLLSRNCKVTLIEEKSDYFHKQRNSSHRFIHPNISFWPNDDLRHTTNLPLLNWHADSCDRVIEQISKEWQSIVREHQKMLSFKPETVYIDIKGLETDLSTGEKTFVIEIDDPKRMNPDTLVGELGAFNFLIDCTGFARERQLDGISSPSYWEFRNPSERVLAICGSGDGGLIEAITHVFDIRMEQIVEFAEEFEEVKIKEELIRALKTPPNLSGEQYDLSKFLTAKKDEITGMRNYPKAIREAKLITRNKDIYTQNTAPIHRILAYLAKSTGKLKIHQDCELIFIDQEKRNMALMRLSTGRKEPLEPRHEVVVRYGPERRNTTPNDEDQFIPLREFARRFELDDIDLKNRDGAIIYEKAVESIYRWLDQRRLKKPHHIEIVDCDDCFYIYARPELGRLPPELFGKPLRLSIGYPEADAAYG